MLIKQIKTALKQTALFVLSLLLIAAGPATAFADTPPADPTTTTSPTSTTSPSDPTSTSSTTPPANPTPAPTTSGPTQPSGPTASTYVYNPITGMWENDYYIWNPVTKQTSPKTPPTYSYNPVSGHWDTTQWAYDPATSKYVPNVVEVQAPPLGALVLSTPLGTSGVSNTGPDSTVNTNNTNNFNGTFNGFYNAAISNNLNSIAQSGDASVTFNTLGGNATSGNAVAMANIINMIQSTAAALQGNNLATFTANINGNVNGDITLNPNNIGPGSTVAQNNATNNNLTINDQQTGNITNNINLDANSGNSTVSKNTTGGNATTGTASAIADITNVINSIIGAGKSFMGVININGNLNGDILLPQNMLNSLIAASGPSTTIDTSNVANTNILANLNNNQAIANNVNANSTSGNADVSHNTTAGNATTGSAGNKLTVLNLTGRTVIGKDCLLVFVNVLGNWVGMIMNAPGANAAALGGNVTTNNLLNSNATLNETSNQTITNNLKLNAQSGNAAVTDNTKAGNATSGNASTATNILNIEGSTFNLSDWLGILFINVFGTWNGSFGVNTSAGDPVGGKSGGGPAGAVQDVKVFQFVPHGSTTSLAKVNSQVLSALAGNSAVNNHQAKLLGGHTKNNTPINPQPASFNAFTLVMAGLGILGFAWIFATTDPAKRFGKTYGKPVLNGLQAASSRLLTFLF